MRKLISAISAGVIKVGLISAGLVSASVFLSTPQALAQITVEQNQLHIDGKPQPQLFGAELQYFRLRGGYGPNVPREKVIALWNQALDRMVEAKMNTVSFYIPWDFHEYAEGKFDFTGTADEDHDGKPDYPSRDILTFFKLVEKHGIHRIMVRPGPYINAEWGFLGFGAIPEWFHKKYPDSHMKTSWGWSTRLYDYHNPDLIHHTEIWFETLMREVLKDKIGPGKPIVFVQLDNETNYQWQSIFNHDYGARSVARYQDFLKTEYSSLAQVNQSHHRQWTDWNQVQPPKVPKQNVAEDQDWYRYSDISIFSYLTTIRGLWEKLGLREPKVLFSLAESYNAVENGLLPHFSYRNAPERTGMMTVNLYPKTYDYGHPLLNLPFKSDLDVKSADAANDTYFGSKQEWVLGPEIQAGWWRDTPVEPAARLQTYLSVVGHGLKAFYVYYFNEGQNWDVDWGYQKTLPLLQALQKEWKVEKIPLNQLSNEFWGELQARSDRLILVGLDVRRILQKDPLDNKDLYFDAPLDGEAQPRQHFYQLKLLGERVIEPYQNFLARSLEVQDSVGLLKDNENHVPSLDTRISNVIASSDWAGGLLGYLMNADINPQILHGEQTPDNEFHQQILFHIDTGMNAPRTLQQLRQAYQHGQTIVNLVGNAVPSALGVAVPAKPLPGLTEAVSLTFYLDSEGRLVTATTPEAKAVSFPASAPFDTYDLTTAKQPGCQGLLYWKDQVVGYQCHTANHHLIQLSTEFFKDYNSGAYGRFEGAPAQKQFAKALLQQAQVKPSLQLSTNAVFTVAFARKDPAKKRLWLTIKTGATAAQQLHLKVSETLLQEALPMAANYTVKEPLSGLHQTVSRSQLLQSGLPLSLGVQDSKVVVIEPSL